MKSRAAGGLDGGASITSLPPSEGNGTGVTGTARSAAPTSTKASRTLPAAPVDGLADSGLSSTASSSGSTPGRTSPAAEALKPPGHEVLSKGPYSKQEPPPFSDVDKLHSDAIIRASYVNAQIHGLPESSHSAVQELDSAIHGVVSKELFTRLNSIEDRLLAATGKYPDHIFTKTLSEVVIKLHEETSGLLSPALSRDEKHAVEVVANCLARVAVTLDLKYVELVMQTPREGTKL